MDFKKQHVTQWLYLFVTQTQSRQMKTTTDISNVSCFRKQITKRFKILLFTLCLLFRKRTTKVVNYNTGIFKH